MTDWAARGREALEIEIDGLKAVRDALGESFDRAVEMLAACRGRVVVTGLGKSGLVGRKLAATFSSTGTPAFFLHPVEGQHGDLGSLRAEDVAIAISNSGRTDELNAILPVLRSLGVGIIALTGDSGSPLARLADLTVSTQVPREACPMNLAPTSSTTATLAVGDALAVCLIERKAFTEKDFRRFHPGGALGVRLKEPVCSLMRREDLPLAPDGVSVAEAVRVLNAGGLGALLLADAGGVISGVLTDGDLRRVLSRGELDLAAPVSGIMTRSFKYAEPGQSVAEVMDIMEGKSITVLPVLDAGKNALGIVHLHDLLGKGRIKFGRNR